MSNITIKTKYSPIPTELYINYLKKLIDKFIKIIPLKEEKSDTVDAYIESLVSELTGMHDLMYALNLNPQIMTLISTLYALLLEDNNYRSEIFKCIQVIKNLESEYRKILDTSGVTESGESSG